MDLKHLTNYQLVLLVLLVSFVTSIATGITTVYLLQQSPTVSSVINQVIQRTVETVAPTGNETIKQANKVVFVKEGDLVPVIVDTIKKSLVTISFECSITEEDRLDGEKCLNDEFGFFTSVKGEFFATEKANPGVSVVAAYPNTEAMSYTPVSKSEIGFTYNTVDVPTGETFTVPQVLAFTKTLPKEGETLILYDPRTESTKKLYVQSIDANKKKFTVDQSLASHVGLPLLTLDGEVAGVIGSEGLVSSLELATLNFIKTDLTNN